MWSPTRILWDQQILLLWLLIAARLRCQRSVGLCRALPFGEAAIQDADGDAPADRPDFSSEMNRRKAA